ncbi:Endoglucanase precursor [Leminorella richardii]|uniref:Glucanase n=2 Tax=Leminorella richardii TaxID=158841 RepID=A0A2X4U700_9GAMM|nr:Endoglucanase precursor [Leminorella richardii]
MVLLCCLMFTGQVLADECGWPQWQSFKRDYVSRDGRVIDPADSKNVTTSEGQSYAMFFALVANDRDAFGKLFSWTENNLAKGDLAAYLPSWLWGKREDGKWGVLDSNSASDADLWIAYSLLEAGRLWHSRVYQVAGARMLKRIVKDEVVNVPGLGKMLMPGRVGFIEADKSWRLNPSYLPPQLLARLGRDSREMAEIEASTQKMLLEAAPAGAAADWILWEKDKGWRSDEKTGAKGDYDAIRVYLWLGALADDVPHKAELISHYQTVARLTQEGGLPPETIDTQTGKGSGTGPIGFSAALLPFLAGTPAQSVQRERVLANLPGKDAYYNSVLTLFGLGWDQQRYRFTSQGELQTSWEKGSCESIN